MDPSILANLGGICCGLAALRGLSALRYRRLSLMGQLYFVLFASAHVFLMGVWAYVSIGF